MIVRSVGAIIGDAFRRQWKCQSQEWTHKNSSSNLIRVLQSMNCSAIHFTKHGARVSSVAKIYENTPKITINTSRHFQPTSPNWQSAWMNPNSGRQSWQI